LKPNQFIQISEFGALEQTEEAAIVSATAVGNVRLSRKHGQAAF
jgi:hypothetical protein